MTQQIYVAYSSSLNLGGGSLNSFLNEWSDLFHPRYDFLGYKNSKLSSHELISNSEFIVAEVSYPSMGVGIECGWADQMGKTIYAFHDVDKQMPLAVTHLKNINLIQYSAAYQIAEKLAEALGINGGN
jgi:hypothetical protein